MGDDDLTKRFADAYRRLLRAAERFDVGPYDHHGLCRYCRRVADAGHDSDCESRQLQEAVTAAREMWTTWQLEREKPGDD